MVNVQLTRTRQTHATTTINEVQSIQLVQTMLHGALSTLTYLREFIPERAYEYRYYEMRETPLPYTDYAAARMPSFRNEADPHSTKLPVLMRDRSKRADVFLDWLVSAFAGTYRASLTNSRKRESSLSSNQVNYAQ
jgi:meiosis-specific protein HOP1